MNAPTTAQWLRTAAHRISVGSGRRATYLAAWTLHRAHRIWQRASGWLAQGEGLGWLLRAAVLLGVAAVLRKVAVAFAAGIYARVEHGGAPWLLWGAAAWWIVSAYRAGAEDWKPKRPAAPASAPAAPEAEEQPEPAAVERAEPPAAPPAVSPVALVAAVRDIGTPHAQLKPLAEHLGTTTDAVRARAAEMGWPVKDVRMAGRSASAGLRWDELPPLPPSPPFPSVVGAGQPTDDNDDDAGGEEPREGVRVVRHPTGVTIYDLADNHRHHTVTGESRT
ncbi:hypothetical protein AB0H51_11415 [Streptomyces griseoluteus]|uniref:hypothetical protein n=1 Tax=Streptomyces griseoluteus TaxID=29306 RepID=UPI0033D5C319